TAASQFGVAALPLWVVALLVFCIPSSLAVRELADIDPGAGGLYRWVSRAFGPRQGFLAGWGYWVNNLFYYPSLLVATAAIAAYIGGPRFVHLGDDRGFIAAVARVGLWLAGGLNVVGLRVGKWLQNLGGFGTWLPALIFVALAGWVVVTRGSATRVTTCRGWGGWRQSWRRCWCSATSAAWARGSPARRGCRTWLASAARCPRCSRASTRGGVRRTYRCSSREVWRRSSWSRASWARA